MGLFSAKLGLKAIASVCQRLAAMEEGGIPMVRAFALLCEGGQRRQMRDVFVPVVDALRGGATLEQALRAQSKYLPVVFVEAVANGERGGRLAVVFRDMARHYEEILRWVRSLLKYLWYPIALIICGAYIIPFFRDVGMYMAMHNMSFDLIPFLKTYGRPHFLRVLDLAGTIGLLAVANRLGLLKPIWDVIARWGWPVTVVTRPMARAFFCRNLALLTGSGLPLVRALAGATAMTNRHFRRLLSRAFPAVQRGATLHEAFALTGFFDASSLHLLATGELSGKLEETLEKVAQYNFDAAGFLPRIWLAAIGAAFYLGFFVISPIHRIATRLLNLALALFA